MSKEANNRNIIKLIKYEAKRENKVQHQSAYQVVKKHRRKASANK
jgi:hypothetical protein